MRRWTTAATGPRLLLVALLGAALGAAASQILGMDGVSQVLAMILGPALVAVLGILNEAERRSRRDVK